MTRPSVCSAVVLSLWFSCSHTQTATDRPKSTGTESSEKESKQSDKVSKRATSKADEPSEPPGKTRDTHTAPDTRSSEASDSASGHARSPLPLATSPAGLLKPGAAKSIQKALADRGYLSPDKQSGDLDSSTQKALRSFQEENHLPATGTPDDRTVRELGLNGADVFKASP